MAPLWINPRILQTLDSSIKRYAHTKRLLACRSLGALKLFRNFARGGFFPSKNSLRFAHLLASTNVVCRFSSAMSRL